MGPTHKATYIVDNNQVVAEPGTQAKAVLRYLERTEQYGRLDEEGQRARPKKFGGKQSP